jgi:hypothetical protein
VTIVLVALALAATPVAARDDAFQACCLADGNCIDVPATICALLGGTVQPEDSCDDVLCPVLGACCMLDLTCTQLSSGDCAAAGGAHQGDGTLCGGVECPLLGACCRPDGSCVVEDREPCLVEGGFYCGTFTGCAEVACTGACVLPDGSCLARVAPAECGLQGGSPLGPGTSCRGVTNPVVVHVASFAFAQNDLAPVSLPRFDDQGGKRELAHVRIEIEATAFAAVSLMNLGPDPIDTTIPFFETVSAALPFPPVMPVVDESGTMACDGMLPPFEACDYGSPVTFPGAGEREFDGFETSFFVGKGTFTIVMSGAGQIGPPAASLVSFHVFPHRAEGFVRVVYEYEPSGACCFGGEACQVVTTSQCASIGGVFVGGTCAGYPCAPPAAPPAPAPPPPRSRRGAAVPRP